MPVGAAGRLAPSEISRPRPTGGTLRGPRRRSRGEIQVPGTPVRRRGTAGLHQPIPILRPHTRSGVGIPDRRLPGVREVAQGPKGAAAGPGRHPHLLPHRPALQRTIAIQGDIDAIYPTAEETTVSMEDEIQPEPTTSRSRRTGK
jgi:hypothetical protein